MYVIYPKPQRVEFRAGQFDFNIKKVFFERKMENVFSELKKFVDFEIGDVNASQILFLVKKDLGEQAYEIEVTEQKIVLSASQEVGFFYAVKTLKQMLNPHMRNVFIHDEPDLNTRGFMFDISRNKVPTVDTIKYVIDLMSDLKMNHLELYVEGFSFEYKSFPQYLEKESYITVEEYKEIEIYANSKYIDLVPNQNGFGHMGDWLKKDEFKDLAESPEGIHLWGTHRDPSTLNPLDPKSFELVKKMYEDMIPHSTSKYFNMNFDEPFELGKGRSKEVCEEKGLSNVYMDFALKAYDEIKKYNKIPLIWGDVLINHTDVLDRVPKDMIFVDWGYDAEYPFAKNLLKLKNAGIKFMAAPGSSSWTSILGRTYDSLTTVRNACVYTKLYGGEGILMTDWGDFGHFQPLSVTLTPLAYAGLLSWRTSEGTYKLLKHYVNKFIFNDNTNIMADLMLDLGNYNRYENAYASNGTNAFHVLMYANWALKEDNPIEYFTTKMNDKILTYQKYLALQDFLAAKAKDLQNANIDEVVRAEVQYGINLVSTFIKVNISLNKDVDENLRNKYLQEVIDSEQSLIDEIRKIWLLRNKVSSLEKSITYINNLVIFVSKLLGGKNGKKQ